MALTCWRWPLVATISGLPLAPQGRCKAASERTPASSMKKISAPSRLARAFRCYGASGDDIASIGRLLTERWLHRRAYQPSRWSPSMRKPKKQKKPLNDLSRSLTPFDPNQTLIVVVELSKRSWLIAGIIPGVERQPLKKLSTDENELLKLLERWRAEAEKAGHKITRIAVAFEAGRDGFWLARWLRARGIEAHVIHAASVAVSREHRRAKTDRLDTQQLKRAFLG